MKWRIVYGTFAIISTVFAVVPSYSAFGSEAEFQTGPAAIALMFLFTTFMVSLSLLFFYAAFRVVELSLDNQNGLLRLTRILWFESSKSLDYDTIKLGSYWFGHTIKTEIHTVSGIKCDNEVVIASDQDSTRVFEMFAWLKRNTDIPCVDERGATSA